MTSRYGLLGRIGTLKNWFRNLVYELRKFGSRIFSILGVFWAIGGFFLLCMCCRVFSLATCRSGMLDLGSYHCEYIFWDVAWEDLSG
eukprot:6456176-Ditylum_brightwellii.AAC.1